MDSRYETVGSRACVYIDDELIVGPVPREIASVAGHDLHFGLPAVLWLLRLRRAAVWVTRERTHERMSYGPLGIARPDTRKLYGRDHTRFDVVAWIRGRFL